LAGPLILGTLKEIPSWKPNAILVIWEYLGCFSFFVSLKLQFTPTNYYMGTIFNLRGGLKAPTPKQLYFWASTNRC
jgi:hypothetical protein